MGSVLIVGAAAPWFEDAVREVGGSPLPATVREQALSVLLAQKPAAILLGAGWHADPTLQGFIEAIRGDWRLHDVPLLAQMPAEPALIAETFRRGGDDVLTGDRVELCAKLGAILAARAAPTPERDRRLLFVGAGRLHRVLFTKLLAGAGYEVSAAETELEARASLETQSPHLAILDLSLFEGDARALGHSLLARGIKVLALTRGPRPAGEPFTHAFDKLSPPEDLLFLINELLFAESAQKRLSPRRLWHAPVRFGDGAFGVAYNLSQTGLFVRTLNPPPLGTEISIEALPADGSSLKANVSVVWRKPFSLRSAQDYPPGFGASFLTRGEGWATAYAALG